MGLSPGLKYVNAVCLGWCKGVYDCRFCEEGHGWEVVRTALCLVGGPTSQRFKHSFETQVWKKGEKESQTFKDSVE